jgi:hypothetical protein
MGVWEDALREAAAQRYEEVQALTRERAQAAEQKRALAAFVDGMHRLRVRPRRHPFLVLKGLPDGNRYRASLRHRIVGWDIGAGAVVTPEGAVYDMRDQNREPCELRRPLSFPQSSDRPRPLTELLGEALTSATQDR